MDDSISRKAVKEWLAKWDGYIDADIIARMQCRVIDIPSAQPTQPNTPNALESLDCISRKAAIDALCDNCDHVEAVCPHYPCKQYTAIEALPTAQPEIVRCGQCKYAEVADAQDNQDGYTCQFHRGSIWFSGSYCSWGERRTDGSD